MLTVGSRHPLKLELFPFISLFLCVIGVLAFLQNLFVLGDIGDSEEEANQPQIFHTPFRVDCFPDRIVLHPPTTALDSLTSRLTLDEKTALEQILLRRQSESDDGGIVLNFYPEFEVEALERLLNEIVTINQLSTNERHPYEEYLLFDIHSGGSDVFHFLRLVLDEPAYRHLRAGLEIADSSQTADDL